jgi:hypothetical protein
MVMPPLRQLDCRYMNRHMNRRRQPGFGSTAENAKPGADRNAKLSNLFKWLNKFSPLLPHSLANLVMALQDSAIRRDGRVA